MASIEFIQKRIAGAEAKISKLEKKLERIEKAEATGWEVNPYYYSESDKRWTVRDLAEARENLKKYTEELKVANEKASSRNVPAILEFLEMWKARVAKYYGDGLKEFFEERDEVRRLYNEYSAKEYGTPEYDEAKAAYENADKVFRGKRCGYYEWYEEERRGRKYRGQVKVRDGEYEYLNPYNTFRNLDEAMAKLQKDLVEEANRKYDFIIERTNEITGKITDATGLKVGEKDDLNGYIKGEKGIAKVQTIGAGGYNIQCFHFRTLIHKAG